MSPNDGQKPQQKRSSCLARGGEMGALMRTLDWSGTPLGPVECWSPTLQTTVRMLLANRFPLLLWWGPHYIQLYNDAYRPIPGAKHPKSMGQPAQECWPEIWHIIGPLIDTPFHGGPATWMEDIFLEIHRHGFVEETHFTIAYSPVPDDTVAGGIGGVLGTVHEITAKVVGERRMVALRDLSSRPAEAKTADEACAVAAKALAAHSRDVPFALLYLLEPDGQRARLAGATGVSADGDLCPALIEVDTPQSCPWPLAEAKRTEELQIVAELDSHFALVPPGPWSDPPNTAVVLPIPSNRAHEIVGFFIAGISARLHFDDTYRGFLDLATAQVATAIANARAYEEEKKRAEALAELNRAKTTFFNNVSHEFRTPLTLMLGPVEELLAKSHTDLSPAAKGQLEVVNRNGMRLLRLVNTLLDFSRIEAERVRAVYEPTNLATFTVDLVSVFRAAMERAGLRLVVDCPPLAEQVYVDRAMWEKIVLNLLSNAFKFTLEGEIEVRLRQRGQTIQMQVRDTGIGIPAEEMPRLFERFHRIENARGRTHEGSGIGLALVQELVRLHGGSVSAQSVLNQGTVFTVTVPLGLAHLPADQVGGSRNFAPTATGASPYVEEALRWLPDDEIHDHDRRSELPTYPDALSTIYKQPEPQDQDKDRPLVLVADDNADMRHYVVRLLASQYQVEAVPDGEAALAAMRRRLPDLILTDVMMPRLDGFGLLRELRADPRTRGLPVIMLSARAGEESRVDGMAAGVDDYLVKPFSARELLARVTAHLQMARSRREASEALQRNEERLRIALANSDTGTFRWDPHTGEFLEFDESLKRLFGLSPETPVSVVQDCLTRVHPDDVQALRTAVDACRQGADFEMEFRVIHPDGQVHWLYGRAKMERDAQDNPTYLVGACTDITRRKQVEQALREADRKKDEFLATLAHELRNPLAPIRNGLQVMKLARDNAAALERSRAMMERQLQHLIRLVDDLLDVSRISQGKIELRREEITLAAVAHAALEACEPHIKQSGHELTVTLPDEPVYLHVDKTRLAQALGNVLNNATKYTPRGGHIQLTAERQGSEAIIHVRDDGIGIPAAMLPRVFDLFTQVDGSLERAQGGLGIGLTLVKRLIEMHGGRIEASSDGPGRGSEFIIRLPIARLSDGQPASQPAGEPASPGVQRRILIVDDNVDAADSLALMLQLMGNEVRTAHDGVEGVAAAAAFRPDLVLLDIGMPKLNGYDACRRIRQQPWARNAMLVALTGWGQEEDKRRSQEAGFDSHLVKPVDPRALERLLALAPQVARLSD